MKWGEGRYLYLLYTLGNKCVFTNNLKNDINAGELKFGLGGYAFHFDPPTFFFIIIFCYVL